MKSRGKYVQPAALTRVTMEVAPSSPSAQTVKMAHVYAKLTMSRHVLRPLLILVHRKCVAMASHRAPSAAAPTLAAVYRAEEVLSATVPVIVSAAVLKTTS